MLDRTVGGAIVLDGAIGIDRPKRHGGAAGRYDLNEILLRNRAQVQHTSTGNKQSPDLSQGIDHALTRHSSQRGGKQSDIENRIAERKRNGARAGKSHSWAEALRATLER